MNNDRGVAAIALDECQLSRDSSREPMVGRIRTTKINAQHRERLAIVYVRQSSPQQVIENTESLFGSMN